MKKNSRINIGPVLKNIFLKCLITIFFVCMAQSSAYSALVGHWVADDWVGGTSPWVDRVSGGIATVLSPFQSPTKDICAVDGRTGLVFDGVNDYLSVASTQNPIVGKSSITIATSFSTNQGASGADGPFWWFPGPLNGEAPGYPNDWGLTYNAAGNATGFFRTNLNISSVVSLIDGQIHTMALTWEEYGDRYARLYVDGNLVGSSTGPMDGGNGVVNYGFVIGASAINIYRFFSGAIGELRFYDSIEDPAVLHAEILSTATTCNAPPIADAGPDQSIRPNNKYTLTGAGSDDNTLPVDLQYSWSIVSAPAGSTAILNSATTATPNITPDLSGTYEIQLIVTDGGGLSSDPSLLGDPFGNATVVLSDNNMAPTAMAAATQLVVVGTPVSLDSQGSSDPEGDLMSFDWLLISQPAGNTATVTDANMAIANIIPNAEGIYEVQLAVSDFLGAGMPTSVTFTSTSAQDFAVIKIKAATDIIKDLDRTQFTHKKNKKKLLKLLSRAVSKKHGHHKKYKGDDDDDDDRREVGEDDHHFNYRTATKNITKSIKRTDGCAVNGSPDGKGHGRDWITDCTVQAQVYGLLMEAKTALTLAP